MPYATQANLVDRFGETELVQLTDRATPPAGTIDATVVTRALTDADNKINSYLAARYTLPFASVPEILLQLACDIARYYLYEDRVTEIVQKRYDNAIAQLRDISAGKASLGLDAEGDVAAPAAGGGPVASGGDRVFTRGKPSTGAVGSLDDFTG